MTWIKKLTNLINNMTEDLSNVGIKEDDDGDCDKSTDGVCDNDN